MGEFGCAHLANFWKIKDTCQEVCMGLENLSEESCEADKNSIINDYKLVKAIINRITATGYFSKAKDVETNDVIKLVNAISAIEEKDKVYTARIWAKNLSKISHFNQNNFKLCVQPYFDANIKDNLLNAKRVNFVETHLISNGNITLKSSSNILDDYKEKRLPYGFVYDVNESNFVGATDESSLLVSKSKSELAETDIALAQKNGEYILLSGYATKLKTPGQIIRKYSNKRFDKNDNLVVLDGESKPCAIFYYSLGIDEVDSRVCELKNIAKQLDLPLIAIDVNAFYKNNGKFFTTSNNIRSSFNQFVDCFNEVILNSCNFDMLAESKKLIGYNTMLRYNFVYKFLTAIKTRLSQEADNMLEFIPKAFRKSVIKKNNLTKEREIANGAPLVYPNEETAFAVPNSFFNED